MKQNQDYEKLIEEMIQAAKTNGDLSAYKKNRTLSPLTSVIAKLNSLPKTQVPSIDFMRIKNQMLDRISVPKMEEKQSSWIGMASWGQILRLGAGIIGSLVIVLSLALGTAVAALNSVPGEVIYPLKKVVENIELKLAPANDKTNLQIKFANNRIDEVAQVIQQQQDGQISAQAAKKIVAAAVRDLKTSAAAAPKSSNQLSDLSAKLKIASIRSEGEVKIELEQAIKDISTPADNNAVSAQGKITAISETAVSIGSVKFLLTKDTKFVNIDDGKLAVDQLVDIEGIIKDNKTYALTISLIVDATQTPATPAPSATQ